MIDDPLGTARVLDGAEQGGLVLKIHVLPCKAKNIAAPRSGLEGELDDGAEQGIAGVRAGRKQAATFDGREADIAFIIHGGALHVFGVHRIEDETVVPSAIVDDALQCRELALDGARRDGLAVLQTLGKAAVTIGLEKLRRELCKRVGTQGGFLAFEFQEAKAFGGA